MTQGRLEGKRALVTGAGSGIGRAVVARFEAEGAGVAGVDLRGAEIAADVTDEAQVERAVSRAVEELGGLDVVVANAGVQLHGADARSTELDLDTWRRTVEVNLTGTFLTCKHGIRALLRTGGGSVVCTSSPTAFAGVAPGYDAYSASKAGVLGLVRALAADYAREGVRVNAVVPGFIATPLVAPVLDDDQWLANVLSTVPLGRAGTPDEVASLILYLASDESTYATGAAFVVDGGMTAI